MGSDNNGIKSSNPINLTNTQKVSATGPGSDSEAPDYIPTRAGVSFRPEVEDDNDYIELRGNTVPFSMNLFK